MIKLFPWVRQALGCGPWDALREATQPMKAATELAAQRENWENAARGAGNISELWLTLGDVAPGDGGRPAKRGVR